MTELDDNIKSLFNAIVSIENKYIKYGSFSEEIKEFENEEPLERVFTYELYHKWSDIIKGSELVLNGEIIKCSNEGKKYYPDFVLHGAQENTDFQEIVCEVKRFCVLSQKNMTEDLNKLELFTNGSNDNYTFNHEFKHGVFIVIGCGIDIVKSLLGEIHKKYSKLICVAYQTQGILHYIKTEDPDNVEVFPPKNLQC